MATKIFRHKKRKGDEITVDLNEMSFADFLKLEKELNRGGYFVEVGSPMIVSGRDGGMRPDETFKDRLREMKKKSGKTNTINV